MNWWLFRKRTVASAASQAQTFTMAGVQWTPRDVSAVVREMNALLGPSTAASQLARHGAEQRRDKIVTKAKAIAERLERPDLVERLTR